MKRILNNNIYQKQRLVISILLLVAFLSISVGYAYYNTELGLFGSVSLLNKHGNNGVLEITSVSENASVNATGSVNGQLDRRENGNTVALVFNNCIIFHEGSSHSYSFDIRIENNSNKSYKFTQFSGGGGTGELQVSEPRLVGLIEGEEIAPGEVRNVILIFDVADATIDHDVYFFGGYNFLFEEGEGLVNPTHNLVGVLQNSEFEMAVGQTEVETTLYISNDEDYAIQIETKSSNSQVLAYGEQDGPIVVTMYPSTNGSGPLRLVLTNPMTANTSIDTTIYFECEDGTIINVGNVRLYNGTNSGEDPDPDDPDDPDPIEPGEVIEGVNVNYQVITPDDNSGWEQDGVYHARKYLRISLENTTDHDITDFDILIKFKNNSKLTNFSIYSGQVTKWNNSTKTWIISSAEMWNHTSLVIPANGSISLLDMEVTADYDLDNINYSYIQSITIVSGGEEFNDEAHVCTGEAPDYEISCRGW